MNDLGNGFYALKDTPPVNQPIPEAFEGKVTPLTGPGNASGVTMLLARIRHASP